MEEGNQQGMAAVAAKIISGGEEFEVPSELLEDRDLFSQVLSLETWKNVLTGEERERLLSLLPEHGDLNKDEVISQLFSGENFKFGNPVSEAWRKLNAGELSADLQSSREQLKQLKFQQYKYGQKQYYVQILQEILMARQELMQIALHAGSMETLPKPTVNGRKRSSALKVKAEIKYRKILSECRKEAGQDDLSSDEEPTDESTKQPATDCVISDEQYKRMLKSHRQKKLLRKFNPALYMSTQDAARKQEEKKTAKTEQSVSKQTGAEKTREAKGGGVARAGSVQGQPTAVETQVVYDVYGPIDAGTKKELPIVPLVINGPVPKGRFMSFFSLIKHIIDLLHDQKGELNKVIKSVHSSLRSSLCSGCLWLRTRPDWDELTLSAMCYLAAEVGSVSSFDPLPHFIPLLEFRDRIDHWKWIGHGRDSDLELLVLCNHWVNNLHRVLPIVDYSDYEPPAPHVWTHFMFRQTTPDEMDRFRKLELERYEKAHKAFIYSVHGFESPVGPVKGARAYKKDSGGSRARGHALLIPDRPNCVTILSLVRDAVSRLPNGEGTRIDLCVLVRDSQFLQETVSDTQLNNAVSGALDRLHYEKDPCVRYDNGRKVWIYLHRGRTEEDFEHIFWACEVATKQRKQLMSRPKIKPKIIIRSEGKDITVQDGDSGTLDSSSTGTTKKQTSKTGQTGLGSGMLAQTGTKTVGPHHVPSSGKSVVVASVVQPGGAVAEQSLNPAARTTAGTVTKPKQKGSVVKPAGAGSQAHGRGKQTPVKGTASGAQQRPKKEVAKKEEPLGAVKGEVPELILPPLHDSDWESSEEELPFLGGALPPGGQALSRGSTSSSGSEDNADTNPSSVNITPKFLANISVPVGVALGDGGRGTGGGDGLGTEKAPSAWLSISSSDSEP